RSADGSVGSPHARVGHCQASNKATSPMRKHGAFCFICYLAFCTSMAFLLFSPFTPSTHILAQIAQ
ncbi:hypothetical protein, partial [Serratia nevei]|uniref:hypothetical protein n=1 Tax=Serratia nevei TaxID=2703794 RepID=UPI003F7741C8